MFIREE
jgi:hypothetical protein